MVEGFAAPPRGPSVIYNNLVLAGPAGSHSLHDGVEALRRIAARPLVLQTIPPGTHATEPWLWRLVRVAGIL